MKEESHNPEVLKKRFPHNQLSILVLLILIHWSWGLHAIINTSIIGAVFMIVMWKTGSVVPLIIAHFLVDYIAFSGIIPGDWFSFMY